MKKPGARPGSVEGVISPACAGGPIARRGPDDRDVTDAPRIARGRAAHSPADDRTPLRRAKGLGYLGVGMVENRWPVGFIGHRSHGLDRGPKGFLGSSGRAGRGVRLIECGFARIVPVRGGMSGASPRIVTLLEISSVSFSR